MAGFIELIAKIKPKNNGKYALVDDVDVEMEDGTRLSDAIKKPKIPSGGKKGQLLAKKSDNDGDGEWVDGLKMEDVDKKLEGKLDKNLGSENPDKILTTDSQGNIVLQDKEDFEGGGVTDYNGLNNRPSINGVTLTGNKISADLDMYTKEEVDKMLYEKMDKPYAPITITNDTTIEDCLDGYFKIDKIKGNTYQAQETDIVPTPQRPVPINSRKTTITKINPNIFDFEKENDTSNIPDSGTYRSIGQYQLKANTKYIFEWSGATVPAKATLSFQIQDDKGTVLVSPFTYLNLQADEKKEAGKEVEFTTNSSGIVKFAYNCTVATSSTIETYQQYWYTKILKDISLKEDVEYATEYVELRSLKETINKFDLGLLSQVDLIPDNREPYRKINIPITLKPNTRYKIYYEKSMIPALTWAVLNIVDNAEEILVPILNVRNTENNEVEKQAINLAFTSPVDGEIYFSYYVQLYNTEGVLVPQTTETFKEKWFTKILKNIMVTEESLNQNTYVAPTIRDYKIVDHTTQTSKIVRNVCYEQKDFSTITPTTETDGRFRYQFALQNRAIPAIDTGVLLSNVSKSNINNIGDNIFYVTNGFANFLSINSDINEDVSFQYQLQTPTEESIPYLEDDTSEVGYSWQDTTSPSPTIKSEVRGVEKIDILRTGKNLFDIKSHEFTTNLQSGKVSANRIVKVNDTTLRVQNPNIESYAVGDKFVVKANKPLIISFDILEITGTEQINVVFYKETGSLLKSFEYRTIKVGTRFVIDTPITTRNNYVYIGFQSVGAGSIVTISNILLEHASIATTYEPPTEQHVNITPPQPLYENDIANVESGDYEYYTKNTTIDFNRFNGTIDLIQDNTVRYYFRKSLAQELDGIILDTLLFDCFTNVNDDSDTIHFKIGGINNEYIFMYIPRGHINNNAYVKEYLSSLNLIANFAVETKTTQPIPQEDLKLLKSLKTEQGVTNIFVGGEVKPTIEARYPQDIASIVNKLQTKLLTLQEEVVKNV